MKSYADLIEQTFYFPTEEFKVKKNELHFHDVNMMEIVSQYGTPLKLTYLPKIGQNIRFARKIFQDAIKKHKYDGDYTYTYCTKSSHFSFVIKEALKNGAHIETSSAYDIPIVWHLYKDKKLDKDINILCNGFKRPLYLEYISKLLNEGFTNCIPILDNMSEL
jgi:arginine decarboxylase